MTEDNNRRRFARVQFPATVQLRFGGSEIDAHLIDISMNGALVTPLVEKQFTNNAEGEMILPLDADDRIWMQIKIVHQQNKRIGCQCTLIDIDSLTHLKQLVAYNLDQPNQIERQISELIREGEKSL